MFIGREKELVLLQQDYIGKAVMVYGKRRVGKTTLIQKALDNCPYQTVYFECLKGTVQENIDSLVDELVRAKILPVALSFSTLQDVFTYLNTLPQKMVVVIDEYPYLKVMNEPTTVDSVFQSMAMTFLRECSPKQAVDASPLQFNLFSHKSRSFSKRFTHGKSHIQSICSKAVQGTHPKKPVEHTVKSRA